MENTQAEKNGSEEFYKLLDSMSEIHNKKSHDYAQASNPFSNFERAGTIASWFTDPVDIAFAVLIGVKLARLAELSTGKIPNNESIEDTHLDGATYMTLWGAYKKEKAKHAIVICHACGHQGLFHDDAGCSFCSCVVPGKSLYDNPSK